ncbi:MAG: D-aminoacylase [Acidobacteriota bacterium]
MRPLGVFLVLAGLCASCTSPRPPVDLVLENVRVVDGTGAPAFLGHVVVDAGVIVAVDDGRETRRDARERIDGEGLVLAPGFVDTHSHHDRGLQRQPEALAAVGQGVTTIVVGQDGGSERPLSALFSRLESSPAAVNVASYSGHNSLRFEVLGENYTREATADEIDSMAELLQADLDAGALGLATGLEYDPGIYSSTSEVMRLAEVAAAAGGRYISHMRSEDRDLENALDELLEIGRTTGIPVQISHFKLARKGLWGSAGEFLAKLDQARAEGVKVTADVYPYEYWQSTMTVLFPERVYDRKAATYALEELAPPEGIRLTAFAPEPNLVGRTLSEIAKERNQDAVTTYLELIETAQSYSGDQLPIESILGTSMSTEDIEALLRWPHTNLCTDGGLRDRHPRGIASYPRVFGRYVRERGVLSLEEAVHKSTLLAARHVGIEGRGQLVAGDAADLVLFDPDLILDLATPLDPWQLSAGIVGVWVNGTRVFDEGESTGARPGQVLRRQNSKETLR